MTDDDNQVEQRENAAEVLEELANLLREGAIYLGTRRDGHNDEYQYGSLLFKVSKTSTRRPFSDRIK